MASILESPSTFLIVFQIWMVMLLILDQHKNVSTFQSCIFLLNLSLPAYSGSSPDYFKGQSWRTWRAGLRFGTNIPNIPEGIRDPCWNGPLSKVNRTGRSAVDRGSRLCQWDIRLQKVFLLDGWLWNSLRLWHYRSVCLIEIDSRP